MRGGGFAVFTIGQDSNDDLVVAHFAKCIVVAVVRRHKSRFVVLFIEEFLGRKEFCGQGAVPTHGLAVRVRHARPRSPTRAQVI